MAAHRLGQVEAYFTVREVLSEASTAADGALSRERRDFCRCRYSTLGLIWQALLFVARLSCVCSRRSVTSGLTLRFERKVIEEPNARS